MPPPRGWADTRTEAPARACHVGRAPEPVREVHYEGPRASHSVGAGGLGIGCCHPFLKFPSFSSVFGGGQSWVPGACTQPARAETGRQRGCGSLSSHPRAPGLPLRTGKCLCCSAVNLESVRKRDRPAQALTATARPFEQIHGKGPGSPSSPSQEARGARLARPGVPSAVGSPRGVCLRLGNHPSLQG